MSCLFVNLCIGNFISLQEQKKVDLKVRIKTSALLINPDSDLVNSSLDDYDYDHFIDLNMNK